MFYIILGILAILLFIPLLTLLLYIALYVFSFGLVIAAIYFAIKYYHITLKVFMWFMIISVVLAIISGIINFIAFLKEKWDIRMWLWKKGDIVLETDIDNKIIPLINTIRSSDENKDTYKFGVNNIPYGRANAFLNYFEKGIDTDEIYYFSVIKNKDLNELREFGVMITRYGVYVSKQSANTGSKGENKFYPFANLWKYSFSDNTLILDYINLDTKTKHSERISSIDTTIKNDKLVQVFRTAIDNGFNHALGKNRIISESEFYQRIDEAEKEFIQNHELQVNNEILSNAGVASSFQNYQNAYNETKNLMNGSQGHGYAAEYGNNMADKLLGKDVINAAQKLDASGRQVKHGADRIVNGQEIQTKYYRSPSETVGAAFEDKQASYLRSDGSGKMMQIEVPRDQYQEALKLMQKRIDDGQVPNIEPGEDARTYVRKGFVTYEQSFNIAKAGTIESISCDFVNGVINTSAAGGITGVFVFASAVWNGKDIKDAAQIGFYTGIKTIGRGAMVSTVSSQLYREKFAIPFMKELANSGITNGFSNPIYNVSNNIAKSISSSTIAKSRVGEAIGLKAVGGKAIVSSSVTAIIVFGPDLCRALTGRISTKQLVKNSAVGASSLLGVALGALLVPIMPITAGFVGGAIGGFVAKKTLDNYIEDDSVGMFQILKEEFLDVVMLSNLKKSEFNKVVDMTIGSKNLESLLRDIYASGDYRVFAREAIITVAVVNVLSERKVITDSMVVNGYGEFFIEMAKNEEQLLIAN